ncbi:hypothetical protein HanXRQr2_Chr12g0528581 [Helianthus annuus]|uniref:Uncharacterized protein n=1 Tax=Helianthus annuus TaxID=4232 RepID=A0A251T098_HELAN|nr:hypothetical protein HanXRQr2_Chr12g0528581 [Helianthus annuus]KAJ0861669.1 hypothetical protein HanPSC8_Chr12g0509271 [Helianthus annuus]
MAYRVQNHSLDIMVPGSQENSGDALLIDIDSNATPTCTYVPKQLSREELTKLLPEKWITNYEQIHQAPVQTTTTPDFVRHQDGQVEVRFARQDRREIFSTISMIQPAEEPHFLFDVCDCQECLDEAYELEYKEDLIYTTTKTSKVLEQFTNTFTQSNDQPFEWSSVRMTIR